jgi:hypothetical protein
MCVQIALNALNSPAVGWVTTTLGPVKIFPLPTGMALVAVSAFPADAPLAALLAAPLAAGALLAPWPAAGLPAGALLEPLPPQAVITPARPTKPTPAIMPRRVASESVCGSCVTASPVPLPNGLPLLRGGHAPATPFLSVRENGAWRCLVQRLTR